MAIVNKTFVDRYFSGANPMGRMIRPTRISQLPSNLLLARTLSKRTRSSESLETRATTDYTAPFSPRCISLPQ